MILNDNYSLNKSCLQDAMRLRPTDSNAATHLIRRWDLQYTALFSWLCIAPHLAPHLTPHLVSHLTPHLTSPLASPHPSPHLASHLTSPHPSPHLAPSALGGTAYGVDHNRLSQMLTIPQVLLLLLLLLLLLVMHSLFQDMVRMFRDDITITVIFFEDEYLRFC